MLAIFCLRLASGLFGALWLLPPSHVNPRFYRTHFLTVLGLAAAATLLLRQQAGPGLWAALGASLFLAFVGSVVWSLERAPGGQVLMALTMVTLLAALGLAHPVEEAASPVAWQWAGDLSSAALLGTATTAMLIGHSYLIAPTMSLSPLRRLLAALFVITLLRMGVAGTGLWFWTAEHSLAKLNEVTLWLPVRWGLGFLAPLILGWMAWKAAVIRSTQSATGILYVVVIFCFLGELTSQLLASVTRITL
jgi:hypothetical protein